MRIQRPRLPPAPQTNVFGAALVVALKTVLGPMVDQLNNISEGRIAAVTNADVEPPSSGEHQEGDYVKNRHPSVLGDKGQQYVVRGWICVEAGTPGVWVQDRGMTGS